MEITDEEKMLERKFSNNKYSLYDIRNYLLKKKYSENRINQIIDSIIGRQLEIKKNELKESEIK